MNLRRSGRRGAVVGAGAATLTAAALVLGPGTAVGASAAPVDEATQAMQEAVDDARQAAEDAAQAAEDAAQAAKEAAQAAQDAVDQATQAAEEAEDADEPAHSGTKDAADTADDEDIDTSPDEVDWLGEDLQNDLAYLQDLPADQRAEEVQQIFRDAVIGNYGEEVENWAERMVDFMDALPQDLQNDLQNAAGMQGDEAQEQLQQIWEGVLDGDYGQDVEMWGMWLRQSFQQWNLGQVIVGDMKGDMDDNN